MGGDCIEPASKRSRSRKTPGRISEEAGTLASSAASKRACGTGSRRFRVDNLEKILQKANELGHLLKQNEIVERFRDLAKRLDDSESSRKLLEEYVEAIHEMDKKVRAGTVIEVAEKRKVAELEERIQADNLVKEYLATQGYYLHLMTQINDAIADPKGEPPKESTIILPNQDSRIIVP
jgi:cell fate (sporulation/competence/biofilm development) regulator YlbF (YheA/YmcA/DUF963 family)